MPSGGLGTWGLHTWLSSVCLRPLASVSFSFFPEDAGVSCCVLCSSTNEGGEEPWLLNSAGNLGLEVGLLASASLPFHKARSFPLLYLGLS